MKRSSKIIITAVTVIGISMATISLVSAGGRYDRCGSGPDGIGQYERGGGHFQRNGLGRDMRGGDRTARMQERMDMIKYKLRITGEQEPAWQAFEQTLAESMKSRGEARQAAREAGRQLTVSERVERMRNGATEMGKVADAIEQLYASLTPEQQKVADEMRPMGRMGRKF
ncbi:MAG: Spy/CpxP family protein refolding chaperone [Sedimenticola sp.]|nr:Spy/CpxP family protein refolding chaperone [Sedimenticola sp.]